MSSCKPSVACPDSWPHGFFHEEKYFIQGRFAFTDNYHANTNFLIHKVPLLESDP